MAKNHLFSSQHVPSETLPVVVLTVAMKPATQALIHQALEARDWDVSISDHKEYISGTRRPAAGQNLRPQSVSLAFVNFDDSVEGATQAAQYLSQTLGSSVTVVAVGTSVKTDLMLAAMRSGCSEFLLKPTADNICELLDRLEARWLDAQRATAPSQGTILSLFGAKGGVGTTTLAVHLALFLVECHKKRVLLIDQRHELGHVCVYLGMDASRCHFEEVVRNVNRLDSELLSGFIGQHSSGLHVLSSPDQSTHGDCMQPEAVSTTLAFLRSEYDYVLLDTGKPLEAVSTAVLEASSQIYLIATPEIGAVRDLSRYIDRLVPQDSFADKLKVVVNRSGSQYAIHTEQIEKAVKLPVEVRVPDCYGDLVRAENLGEPISPQSKSDLAPAVLKWADAIVGSPGRVAAAAKKSGVLSMLKNGLPPRFVANRAL